MNTTSDRKPLQDKITKLILTAFLVILNPPAISQEREIYIPAQLWKSLTSNEKEFVASRYSPLLVDNNAIGKIIDAQSMDESTLGSNSGSQAGTLIGSAIYIDGALRGRSYSAKEHLGASMLGALAGSTLDKIPEKKITTRYTIKHRDGEVSYATESDASTLRHSIGLCVLTNPIKPINQATCDMTKEMLLRIAQGEPLIETTPKQRASENIATNNDEEAICKTRDGYYMKINREVCIKSGGSMP